MATDTQVGIGAASGGVLGWYLSTGVYKQKSWVQWLTFVWAGTSLGWVGANVIL